jgi:hypothetical protein
MFTYTGINLVPNKRLLLPIPPPPPPRPRRPTNTLTDTYTIKHNHYCHLPRTRTDSETEASLTSDTNGDDLILPQNILHLPAFLRLPYLISTIWYKPRTKLRCTFVLGFLLCRGLVRCAQINKDNKYKQTIKNKK